MREKDSRNLKKRKKQSVHSRRDKLIQNKNIILSERKIFAELGDLYRNNRKVEGEEKGAHTGRAGLVLHPTYRPFTSVCSVCLPACESRSSS